jgi:hypothetical protein
MRPIALISLFCFTGCGAEEGQQPADDAVPAEVPADVAAPPTDAFGNDGPALLRVADVAGQWSVICQVDAPADEVTVQGGHHGVQIEPGFQVEVVGLAPEPVVIDRFVAASSTGDHLLVVQGGRLTLHDTRAHTVTPLDGYVAEALYGLPDIAGFDRRGETLVYLRGEGPETRAIVRDLASGTETELDHGGDMLWRVGFASDDWIVAHVLVEDADGNGAIEGPKVLTSVKTDDCTGQSMMGTIAGMTGDKPETRLIPADGGEVRRAPNLASVAGAVAFEVDPAGAIHKITTAGDDIVAEGCTLVGASVDGANVLGACGDVLTWFGSGEPKNIEARVTPGRETVKQVEDAVWVKAEGDAEWVIDLATGTAIDIEDGYQPRVAAGRKVLLHNGQEGKMGVLDLDSGQTTMLVGISEANLRHVRDHLALIVPAPDQPHGWVVDLQKASIVGTTSPEALALTASGHVLVPTGDTTYEARVVDGPLKWTTPEPPAG